MGHFSFLVMATPRKENMRCHLTTNLYQSPAPCIRRVLSCKEVLWLPLLGNVSQKKYSWSEAEDRATVQFNAMHKAEQATDNDWPAMRLEFGSKIY